jgi:hypothetical protein
VDVSYDFAVTEEREKHACACGRQEQTFSRYLGNPTYNLGDIFRRATGGRFKQGMMMPLPEALEMWTSAHKAMTSARQDFIALEPPNGWGTLDGAIEVAAKCARAIADIIEQDEPIELYRWQALEWGNSDEEKRVVDKAALRFTA